MGRRLRGSAPARAGEVPREGAVDPTNLDGTYKLGYLLPFKVM